MLTHFHHCKKLLNRYLLFQRHQLSGPGQVRSPGLRVPDRVKLCELVSSL
jgi:hypothetical protein